MRANLKTTLLNPKLLICMYITNVMKMMMKTTRDEKKTLIYVIKYYES